MTWEYSPMGRSAWVWPLGVVLGAESLGVCAVCVEYERMRVRVPN